MKEELQGKLVEILTSIQTAAGKASDFAMEQLPDIAQSYVAYGRAYYTLIVLAFMVISVVLGRMVWKCARSKRFDNGEPAEVLGTIFGAVGMCLFVGVGIAHLSGLLLVWFAPKVWLLKEIASLIK